MVETIRYGLIGKQDIRTGLGTFEIELADGRIITINEFDFQLPSSTFGGLPPAGTAGRRARITDDVQGTWGDNGTRWFPENFKIINALEANIVADGVIATGAGTDNSAGLQAAINRLTIGQITGIKALYIPGGIYRLNSQVTVPSGVVLLGAGKFKTVLMSSTPFTDTGGLVRFTGAGGTPTDFRGISIVAPVGGVTGNGIVSVTNGTVLSDIYVNGFNDGVRLEASDNFLSDFIIELNTDAGVRITAGHVSVENGVLFQNGNGLVVANNAIPATDEGQVKVSHVRDTQSTSIGFAVNGGKNVDFSNISVWDGNGTKYQVAGLYLTTANRVAISNFTAHTSNAINTVGDGIRMDAGVQGVQIAGGGAKGFRRGISGGNALEVTVTAFTARGNNVYGFQFAGGDRVVLAGNLAVQNGTVGGASDAGFFIDASAASSLYTLTGNLATQTGGGPQDFGFDLSAGASSEIKFVGNHAAFNGTTNIREAGTIANIHHFGDAADSVGAINRASSGATSVADGGTITHNLGTTPLRVQVTPSVASQFVSVTAIGATTFTVAIKTDTGAAGTTQTVYWRAES